MKGDGGKSFHCKRYVNADVINILLSFEQLFWIILIDVI